MSNLRFIKTSDNKKGPTSTGQASNRVFCCRLHNNLCEGVHNNSVHCNCIKGNGVNLRCNGIGYNNWLLDRLLVDVEDDTDDTGYNDKTNNNPCENLVCFCFHLLNDLFWVCTRYK